MANLYHFAVTDIQFLICVPGVTVVLTTDTPCHLYMRWTNQLPLVHLDPYIRRGVAVGTRPRYCFDLYHDNEQFETGDSITHTFLKPTWACCETRYFYFWGCKFGYLMPSETTIFEYHNPYLDPQWIDCFTIGQCVRLSAWPHNWPAVKTAWPNLCQYNIHIESDCGLLGGMYHIARGAVSFDTSLIPKGSHICAAKLRLHDATPFWWIPGTGDFTIDVCSANDWDGTNSCYWYPSWDNNNDICCEYYVPPMMPFLCRERDLTDLGKTLINSGAITRYVFRNYNDVYSIDPAPAYDEYVAGVVVPACPGRLQVQYCPPC